MPETYVAAEWVTDADGGKIIKAEGDDGKIYYVPSLDSTVPPWPRYVAEGGEVKGEPPE